MAYSTNADVSKEFKNIDITEGLIDTGRINGYIVQADAYINGRIGLIYETPVTGTESLAILKEISIGFVAQRIAFILETKSITPKGDQAVPKDLATEAKERLQMIVDRELLLSDATELSTESGVKSFTSSNVVERKFLINTEQW